MDNQNLDIVLNNWSAADYAKGNYILSEISKLFLKRIPIHVHDFLLDAGCGDGSFTTTIAHRVPYGRVLGLDRSKNMIDYANKHYKNEHTAFAIADIQEPIIYGPFDNILSFWCLHWTNLEKSLLNLYHVLRPKGKIYAVFSSGQQSTLFDVLNSLQFQNQYPDIAQNIIQAKARRENFAIQCRKILENLPFKNISFTVESSQVELPSIKIFENFIHGAPLFKDLPAEIYQDIVSRMTQFFSEYCKERHGNKLVFENMPYFLTITKEE
ncbi:SAM-dependent methlyltransferase [Legionella norrlandica]|uniref:SAM-dependent methlyltransferase n=1 Tax=Legionella norrlandica TaxID=1498499 RepID=A0A0A2SU80_9GAMM|nr:class I SAM-dependent methyltransferase [Legionella norrlandica]KGP63281.1 SAM-dependent methlyltransferase [Legionella norrlandica]